MADHTRGPWEARKFDDTKAHSIYAEGGNRSLASVRHADPAVQEANANLIAQAPTLLECLEALVMIAEGGQDAILCDNAASLVEVLEASNEAIVRAKGG